MTIKTPSNLGSKSSKFYKDYKEVGVLSTPLKLASLLVREIFKATWALRKRSASIVNKGREKKQKLTIFLSCQVINTNE